MDDMLVSYIETSNKYKKICLSEENNVVFECLYKKQFDYNKCNLFLNLYFDCINFKLKKYK
jgi:hypothetical protein